MFIPLLNAFVLFMWLYNYSRVKLDGSVFAKSLLILFASTIPLAIVQIILQKLLADFSIVTACIDYLMLYLIPFSMAFNLIAYQKKVFNKNTEEDSQPK